MQPGGIHDLELGHYSAWIALVNGGFVTVEQVATANDDELLALPGIGPKRLRAIRGAVKAVADTCQSRSRAVAGRSGTA